MGSENIGNGNMGNRDMGSGNAENGNMGNKNMVSEDTRNGNMGSGNRENTDREIRTNHPRNPRKCAAVVLAAGALLCISVSIFLWHDYRRAVMEADQALMGLRPAPLREERDAGQAGPAGEGEEAGTGSSEAGYVNPYGSVFREYPDIRGWLQVEGTVIDYPVLQRDGEDEYYLYLDFRGEEDKRGSLILDEDSSVEGGEFTTNLLIHGHNMKDGSMFGGLDGYRSEDYYREHKYISLYTEDGEHHYEVMAAFDSQVYYASDQVFKYYNFFQADTEEEFHYFYDNVKELALYDTGVEAEFGDRFLTLSTCAYHVEDGRFVVVAKETGM